MKTTGPEYKANGLTFQGTKTITSRQDSYPTKHDSALGFTYSNPTTPSVIGKKNVVRLWSPSRSAMRGSSSSRDM